MSSLAEIQVFWDTIMNEMWLNLNLFVAKRQLRSKFMKCNPKLLVGHSFEVPAKSFKYDQNLIKNLNIHELF